MAESIDRDIEALRTEIGALQSGFARVGDVLASLVTNGTGEAYNGVRVSAAKFKEDTKHVAERAAKEIDERPVMTAAAALTVGFVLGLLWSRRN